MGFDESGVLTRFRDATAATPIPPASCSGTARSKHDDARGVLHTMKCKLGAVLIGTGTAVAFSGMAVFGRFAAEYGFSPFLTMAIRSLFGLVVTMAHILRMPKDQRVRRQAQTRCFAIAERYSCVSPQTGRRISHCTATL